MADCSRVELKACLHVKIIFMPDSITLILWCSRQVVEVLRSIEMYSECSLLSVVVDNALAWDKMSVVITVLALYTVYVRTADRHC